MTIQSLDHVTQGVDRLTSYFEDSTNAKKLLEICLAEFQELEEVILVLAGQKDISTVVGVWLDYIGLIVGKSRGALSDEEYRSALMLKVAVNTANGTHPSTSEIIKTYTESEQIHLAKGILSWGQIIFDGNSNADLSLYKLVQDIIPVTTATLILQDTDKKCFFPAWEDSSWEDPNSLSIHTGDLFEFVLDDSGTTSTVSLMSEDSIGGVGAFHTDRWVLEWEEPVNLELDDGGILEFRDEEGSHALVLSADNQEALNETLLPWEITEDCVSVSYEDPTPLEWFDETGGDNLEIIIDETTTDILEIYGVPN